MGQLLVSIRMDDDLKKQFDSVCNELGLNMTSAITIFAKKMVREHGIPFDVSMTHFIVKQICDLYRIAWNKSRVVELLPSRVWGV